MSNNSVESLSQSIVAAIIEAFGPDPLSLHEPYFGGNEWSYLKECLDSTYVSSVGRFVDQFEHELAAYTGAKYAIAVVNGTAALHIALKLAGVQAEDEVLLPALTFVATANAITYCGAVPHFVDADRHTLGIDSNKLREYLTDLAEMRHNQCINRMTGRVIRAIVPMHTFGHPTDMEGVLALARDFNLVVVEDAAESLGSTYYGQHTGTFGLMGILSFNGNKTITTGGGGAILTNDLDLAKHVKHITTTAKIPHRWEYTHDEIGYNYRLPNINAALGCAQLEQLPKILEAKRQIFSYYQRALSKVKGIHLIQEGKGCRSNYWLQAIALDKPDKETRDSILTATNDAGFVTRPIWRLMHRMPQFADFPSTNLLVAEALETQVINLPSSVYHKVWSRSYRSEGGMKKVNIPE